MSNRQKARLLILPILLVLLFGALRYILHPVDLYDLMPDLEPDRIEVTLSQSDADPAPRQLTLSADDASFAEVLSQLETLRFKRTSTIPIFQTLPFLSSLKEEPPASPDGSTIAVMTIILSQERDDGTRQSEELTFQAGTWSLRDTGRGLSLPLKTTEGAAVGQELSAYLWALSGETQSVS